MHVGRGGSVQKQHPKASLRGGGHLPLGAVALGGAEHPWGEKLAQSGVCHSLRARRRDGQMPAACLPLFGERRACSLALSPRWSLYPPIPGAPRSNAGVPSVKGHGCSWKSIPVPPRPPGNDGGRRAAKILEVSGGAGELSRLFGSVQAGSRLPGCRHCGGSPRAHQEPPFGSARLSRPRSLRSCRRTSCGTPSCWCLPTSRTCPTPWR